MPDYSKGKIYKLYNEDKPDKVYIGSTIRKLNVRYINHKCDLKCASKILFEDNKIPTIELLENYPCNSKYELAVRERYWIEQYSNRINKYLPITSEEEKKQQKKEWSQNNPDKVREKNKKYRDNHKEKRSISA